MVGLRIATGQTSERVVGHGFIAALLRLRLLLLLLTNNVEAGPTGVLNIGGVFNRLTAAGIIDNVGTIRMAGFLFAVRELNNKTDGIAYVHPLSFANVVSYVLNPVFLIDDFSSSRDDILPDVHVNVAIRDSRLTFANTVAVAQEFVQQRFQPTGVHAVMGAYEGPLSMALASYMQARNNPYVRCDALQPASLLSFHLCRAWTLCSCRTQALPRN